MDYIINESELEALCGMIHFHQLAYLRGLKPYMDVQTGFVGIKRRISYQSIAEQLYIEPHQGIQSGSLSRAQIRRALSALERVGLVHIQSEKLKLILKCPLATLGYFVQNKPVTKASQKDVSFRGEHFTENKEFLDKFANKADIVVPQKAVTPLYKDNYYIFLSTQFEQFWNLYPLKNSQPKAWQVFQELNPTSELIAQILKALHNQINYVQREQALGNWVPNWKNPANWLAQSCWNDVIPTKQPLQENHHAKNKVPYRKHEVRDTLWDLCNTDRDEPESTESNIIPFSKWRG